MVLKYRKISSLNRTFSANYVLIRVTISENIFSWKWKWMVMIRSMCSVCHILKFLNMQRNFGYSAVRENFFNRRFDNILLFRLNNVRHRNFITWSIQGEYIRNIAACLPTPLTSNTHSLLHNIIPEPTQQCKLLHSSAGCFQTAKILEAGQWMF